MSIIFNFQRRQTFQFTRCITNEGWNVIIFEKVIVSLNILVDYKQLSVASSLWVLITYLVNRAQTYYETKPYFA